MSKRLVFSMFVLWSVLSVSSAVAAIIIVDCDDGEGDFNQINPAVDAAAPGDVIVVRECGATYNAFVVSMKTDIHIVAADVTNADGVGSQEIGVGANPFTFMPIATVNGAGNCATINNTSARILIKGLNFEDCGGQGIVVRDSTNVQLIGNRVFSVDVVGILDEDSNSTQIEGNVIGVNGGSGVVIAGSGDARVADNLIGLNGGDGSEEGVRVVASAPFAESGGPEAAADSNTIINNTIVGNDDGCIFDDSINTRIETNTCEGSVDQERKIIVGPNASGGEIIGNIGIIEDELGGMVETAENCDTGPTC